MPSTIQDENLYVAKRLSDIVDIPVILIGENRHLDIMEDLLDNANIEYFLLARTFTAELDLINIWASVDRKKLSVFLAISTIQQWEKDVS